MATMRRRNATAVDKDSFMMVMMIMLQTREDCKSIRIAKRNVDVDKKVGTKKSEKTKVKAMIRAGFVLPTW